MWHASWGWRRASYEGRAQARAYHNDHFVDARLASGPGWGDVRIVNDGLVVNSVRETFDFDKGRTVTLEPGPIPVFAASCWPVGVNPQ